MSMETQMLKCAGQWFKGGGKLHNYTVYGVVLYILFLHLKLTYNTSFKETNAEI